MRRLMLAALCHLLLIGPALAEEPGLRAVIAAQIDAFQADDFDTAFGYASDAIRRIFGTPERFGQMVQQGYPMVHRPADLRFLEAGRRGAAVLQRVMVADQAQRLHVLEYEMIETPEGWRINGVRLLPGGAAGV